MKSNANFHSRHPLSFTLSSVQLTARAFLSTDPTPVVGSLRHSSYVLIKPCITWQILSRIYIYITDFNWVFFFRGKSCGIGGEVCILRDNIESHKLPYQSTRSIHCDRCWERQCLVRHRCSIAASGSVYCRLISGSLSNRYICFLTLHSGQ